VAAKGLLDESAIIIEAGNDHEDRLMTGSYRDLREQEASASQGTSKASADSYLPEFLNQPSPKH
jgi:hypothetical protein